jgi:hypothetical protein
MLPEADIIRLQHMLDSALEAIEFAENRDRGDLARIIHQTLLSTGSRGESESITNNARLTLIEC